MKIYAASASRLIINDLEEVTMVLLFYNASISTKMLIISHATLINVNYEYCLEIS